ncbi:hypothetical protein DL96DRAFT_909970 [Flagelloscypha sp. PMI_526]|nr:hypothetical protein DL96DRAFT_909970 [Flagelloscypha sp. PMI_526]
MNLDSKAKLFITSRPIPLWDDWDFLTLPLMSSNEVDLEAYIEVEVSSIAKRLNLAAPEKADLIKTVTTASSDLFLLANLHFQSFARNRTKSRLIKTAQTLPTTPGDYYVQTLERIHSRGTQDPEDTEAALAALLWVWKAKRPLYASELSEAVASVLEDLTGRPVESSLIPEHDILELCEGFLHIVDGIVTFSRRPYSPRIL